MGAVPSGYGRLARFFCLNAAAFVGIPEHWSNICICSKRNQPEKEVNEPSIPRKGRIVTADDNRWWFLTFGYELLPHADFASSAALVARYVHCFSVDTVVGFFSAGFQKRVYTQGTMMYDQTTGCVALIAQLFFALLHFVAKQTEPSLLPARKCIGETLSYDIFMQIVFFSIAPAHFYKTNRNYAKTDGWVAGRDESV